MRFRSAVFGDGLVRAGSIIALAGVPLVVLPFGHNPFGPVKLFVLCASAALVALGLSVGPSGARRVRDALSQPVGLWLSALAVLFVLAGAVAADPRAALIGAYPGYEAGLVALGAALTVGFAAAATLPDAPATVSRTLCAALVIAGLATIVARLTASPDAAWGGVGGTLGNPSNLGLWCAVALPWAARVLSAEESRAWRALSVAAIAAGVTGVVLSGSRGAALALLVESVVGAGLLWRSAGRLSRGATIGLVLLILAACAVLGAQVAAVADDGGPDTVTGRLDTWRSTVPLIAEHPFLGVGPAGFGRAFAATTELPLTDSIGRDRPLEDPHNVLLSTAISAGPVALVCLVGLACSAGALAWRCGRQGADVVAAAASLAAGFAGLQFHFLTLDVGPVLFASLGVLVAVCGRPVPGESSATRHGTLRASRGVRVAAAVCAAAFLGATVCTARVVGADAAVRAGFADAPTDWSQASRHLERARALAPWDPAFPWAIGRAARDAVGDGDDAVLHDGEAALAAAARMRPGDHRIARDLGDLYAASAFARGRDPELLDLAARSYEDAIALAPTDALNRLGLGSVQLAAGQINPAVTQLTQAVGLAPELKVAWENLASARSASGDTAGAHEASERAKELGAEPSVE